MSLMVRVQHPAARLVIKIQRCDTSMNMNSALNVSGKNFLKNLQFCKALEYVDINKER